jgi:hypothetical protein
MKKVILFTLISFLGFQNPIFGQTMDSPMPLTEGSLTISSSNEVKDYYYTFDAQIGEIVITGDGMGNSGVFFVGLLNTDFKSIKPAQSFISGTPTRRAVIRISIGKAQKVIMKVKAPKSTNASLKLLIEGTAQFGGSYVPTTAIPTPVVNTNNTDTPQTTTDSPQTPATGENVVNQSSLRKVFFTLKNGQVLEGSFGDIQITNIGDKKLGVTIRYGKNLPQAELKDIQSIRIE